MEPECALLRLQDFIFSVNCSFYTQDSNHAGKYKYLDLGLIDKIKYEHESVQS